MILADVPLLVVREESACVLPALLAQTFTSTRIQVLLHHFSRAGPVGKGGYTHLSNCQLFSIHLFASSPRPARVFVLFTLLVLSAWIVYKGLLDAEGTVVEEFLV